MCGLAGFATFACLPDEAEQRLCSMTRAIAHRGPDAEGHWLDTVHGVGLGHRRLSILDLSPAGTQPMHSECGRYVIVFNGEIYTHLTLRHELEMIGAAPQWRGHSDTETLLAAIVHWGLTDALRRASGMFALALWDRQKQVLALARDRVGEKPLYLAQQGEGWAFGSELRALIAGGLAPQIDRAALAAYLRLGHVPDHLCILQGVDKVMPGGIVRLRAGIAPEYLRYDAVEDQFGQTPVIADADRAIAALELRLAEVVETQMLSDVALGCFLSGGIDSSLVASIMQAGSDRQIHSFSIGFEDSRFNEAPHAAAVARHLGTAHTEFILREEDALALVPDLAQIYDEPFADSSQIPTALLCRAARAHVSVALTGDGGDEVFGGYNRHIRGPALWSRIARLPKRLRPLAAGATQALAGLGLRHERVARGITRAFGLPLTTLDNLPRLARALHGAKDAEAFYQTFLATGPDPAQILTDPVQSWPADPRTRDPQGLEMAEWLMARDLTAYLPGDILVKVDRAAMSVALETRAPFLDARILQLARQIPIALHVDGRRGKILLRAVLERHVPNALIDRPKQGFAIPLDDWLRGALRGWGEDLLGQEDLCLLLGLNSRALHAIWANHQAARANLGRELWTVLMLLLWARNMELTGQ